MKALTPSSLMSPTTCERPYGGRRAELRRLAGAGLALGGGSAKSEANRDAQPRFLMAARAGGALPCPAAEDP